MTQGKATGSWDLPHNALIQVIDDLEEGGTRRQRAARAHPDVARAWNRHRKAWEEILAGTWRPEARQSKSK